MAMILIIRTCAHKNPPEDLKKYVPELMPVYKKVFDNNNHRLLQKFFKEDLIQQLWAKYPSEDLAKYLRSLNEDQQRLIKKDFMKYNLEWPLKN